MILQAVGIAIFIASVVVLFAPLLGWRHKFYPGDMPVTVDIPKPGRYSFFISRYRALGGRAAINFSIAIFDARAPLDESRLISSHSLKSAAGESGYTTIRAGAFNAPYAGKYAILGLADNQLASNDKIIIRRPTSRILQLIAVAGITISPFMFTTGLAGGLASLIGLIGGIIILLLNL